MHWYAGPWIWDESFPGRPCWRAPSGLTCLDLRTLEQQSTPGGSPGFGVFSGDVEPGKLENASDYTHLGEGSWLEVRPTGKKREAITARKGYTPAGDTLAEILLDALTFGADPSGIDGPKPLVPTGRGELELHLGQSVKTPFTWGSPHTAILADQLKQEFAALWAEGQAGKLRDAQQPLRVLDYWQKKYRAADWADFVPASLRPHVPGPVPHDTTIAESFNKADSSTLGPDLSWTELEGDWEVFSNEARVVSAAGYSTARANSDLSSSDHYCQAVMRSVGRCAPATICRKDGTATMTFYMALYEGNSDVWQTRKRVAGTETTIGTNTGSATPSLGDVLKIHCNGSTISRYRNGVSQDSTTDTAISGNVRCGILGYYDAGAFNSKATFDSFEAADLATVITGDLSVTLGAATLSSTGTERISGALAATLADATGGSAGIEAISGAATGTLAALTLSAAGSVRIAGDLATTLDGMTLASEGGAAPAASEESKGPAFVWVMPKKKKLPVPFSKIQEEEEALLLALLS